MENLRRLGYKVKKQTSTGAHSIAVPADLVVFIPEGVRFLPELCEEGILYRIVQPQEVELPNWAKKEE